MSGSPSYALDSSVLLYHKYRPSEKTRSLVRAGVLNVVTLSEVLYVICRNEGVAEALAYVERLVEEARLAPPKKVAPVAGQFKCRFPVSLADAWVLATREGA